MIPQPKPENQGASTAPTKSLEENGKTENNIKNVRHKLINVSLIVTVLALLLSMVQVWQARDAELKIRNIAESVSTKYLDEFPKNIPSINKLFGETTSSLLIVTDFPAYGFLYHHKAFEEYRQRLEELTLPGKSIEIRLLIYNEATRKKKLEFFLHDKGAEQLAKIDFFQSLDTKDKPKTFDEAWNIINSGNEDFRKELGNRKVAIHETATDLPVFVWIRDNKEAIFSFYFYGQAPGEVSFHTIDPKLIKVLRDIAEAAFNQQEKPNENPAPVDKLRAELFLRAIQGEGVSRVNTEEARLQSDKDYLLHWLIKQRSELTKNFQDWISD
jgi:hypothetical protein